MQMRHRAPRPALLFLTLASLAGAAACDDSSTDVEEGGSILGTWVAVGSDWTEYVRITEDSVIVFTNEDRDCFARVGFEIVGSAGSSYALRSTELNTSFNLVIQRSGEALQVGAGEYQSSDQDLTELQLCIGGGGDSITPCTELPQVAPDGSVQGALEVTDRTSPTGAFFDLYGLQLDAPRTVTIELASDVIDSYLWVWEGDGGLIAENDDADSETFDAALTLQLGAGCYRIEASSYGPDEVGTYTLTVR